LKKISRTSLIIVVIIGILCIGGLSWAFFSNNDEAVNGVVNGDDNGDKDKEKDKEPDDEMTEEEKRELIEKERKQREKELKEEMGEYFVPLPPVEQEDNPPVKARGLYLTGHSVANEARLSKFLELAINTEINSIVIDVKSDDGIITHPSDIEFVNKVNTDRLASIDNLSRLVERLNDAGIYTIARVVVFKDNQIVDERPEWGLQRRDGGVWRDRQGVAWVDPHHKEIWDYNLAVAREAALEGFNEIQFDYVRFPDNAAVVDREVDYAGERDKDKVITEFLEYARSGLEEYNVHVSADTFGVIATSWGDADNIGQNWEKIAPVVDVHCPMVYPSHYGPGYFGYQVPDAEPGGTITNALQDALKRNAPIENPGRIRPYLQAFTATWVRGNINYGSEEVMEQIKAAYELGIDEYLLWCSSNTYVREGTGISLDDALFTREETEAFLAEREEERKAKGLDNKKHSVKDAAEEFLEGVKRNRWKDAYFYHSTGFTKDHRDYEEWAESWSASLEDYEIASYGAVDGSRGEVEVKVKWEGEEEARKEEWEAIKENKVWRVIPSEEFLEILVTYEEEDENGDNENREEEDN